jgi:hypothetical protein
MLLNLVLLQILLSRVLSPSKVELVALFLLTVPLILLPLLTPPQRLLLLLLIVILTILVQ